MAMANLTDVCNIYGISRSTALRRIKACFGDAPKRGNAVYLDASQMQVLADYLDKHGDSVARHIESTNAPETHQRNAIDAPEVRALVTQYEARIRDLQDEIDRLHEALAREQQSHVGFWTRLGQRLLGSGARD